MSTGELAKKLATVELRIVQPTVVYRAYRFQAWLAFGMDAHPLNGTRRGRVGGRYNPPGSPPTVYTATSRPGASLEMDQAALLANLPSPSESLDILAIFVKGVPLLDLTDRAVLDQLGIGRDALLEPTRDWGNVSPDDLPLTQRLGQLARERFCGIFAPSVLEKAVRTTYPLDNVVLFLEGNPPWQPREGRVLLDDPRGLYQ